MAYGFAFFKYKIHIYLLKEYEKTNIYFRKKQQSLCLFASLQFISVLSFRLNGMLLLSFLTALRLFTVALFIFYMLYSNTLHIIPWTKRYILSSSNRIIFRFALQLFSRDKTVKITNMYIRYFSKAFSMNGNSLKIYSLNCTSTVRRVFYGSSFIFTLSLSNKLFFVCFVDLQKLHLHHHDHRNGIPSHFTSVSLLSTPFTFLSFPFSNKVKAAEIAADTGKEKHKKKLSQFLCNPTIFFCFFVRVPSFSHCINI